MSAQKKKMDEVDCDPDSVERLLAELEGVHDVSSGSRGRAAGTAARSAGGLSPSNSASGSSGKVMGATVSSATNFSTYELQGEVRQEGARSFGGQGANTEGPRVAGGAKLKPLHGRRSTGAAVDDESPLRGTATEVPTTTTLWSQYKTTVSGLPPTDARAKPDLSTWVIRTSTTSATDSAAGRPAAAGGDVRTTAPPQLEPNFLPVMHARFIRDANGITPRARWGHTLTALGESLYMFGGTTGDSLASNDLFQFDAPSSTWEPVLAGERQLQPTARYHHAASPALERYVVVAGGRCSHGSASLGDIVAYDTVQQTWLTWYSPAVAFLSGEGEHSSGSTTTAAAAASQKSEFASIFGHSMVSFKQRLYLFGGRVRRSPKASAAGDEGTSSGAKETCSNDVYVFDCVSRQFRKRVHVGSAASAAGDSEGGGASALVSAATTAGVPAKRCYHSACLHRGSLMIIHGGESSDGTVLTDTWALDLHTRRWTCLHSGTTTDAVPRSHHGLFSCGEAVLAVGGVGRNSGTAVNPRYDTFLAVLPVSKTSTGEGVSTGQWSPVVLGHRSCTSAAQKNFGAAEYGGFIFVFGGQTGAEGSTNHLIRCLAMDGVSIRQTEEVLGARLKHLVFSPGGGAAVRGTSSPSKDFARSGALPAAPAALATGGSGGGGGSFSSPRWDSDMCLVHGSTKFFVHRALLSQRCGAFFSEILACRFEEGADVVTGQLSSTFDSSAHAPSAGILHHSPMFYLEGNSRVKGLSVATTAEVLAAFLEYLYTGDVVDDVAVWNSSGRERIVAGLTALAKAFHVGHLAQLLEHKARRFTESGAAAVDAAEAEAQEQSARHLAEDMSALLESAAYANATLMVVDPHTGKETSHAVHTFVIANACGVLCQLLRPLWTDLAKSQSQVAGITAKLSSAKRIPAATAGPSSGRRTAVVGPVKIPSLSVKAVLEYMYTGSTRAVTQEAALPTLIAAQTLGLSLLQAHCESLVARHEVNFATCCDFLTLARNHRAPLLAELCLVTAAVGFDEVKRGGGFATLDASEKKIVEEVAGEVRGHWAPPPAPKTEQKEAQYYAARLPPPL